MGCAGIKVDQTDWGIIPSSSCVLPAVALDTWLRGEVSQMPARSVSDSGAAFFCRYRSSMPTPIPPTASAEYCNLPQTGTGSLGGLAPVHVHPRASPRLSFLAVRVPGAGPVASNTERAPSSRKQATRAILPRSTRHARVSRPRAPYSVMQTTPGPWAWEDHTSKVLLRNVGTRAETHLQGMRDFRAVTSHALK